MNLGDRFGWSRDISSGDFSVCEDQGPTTSRLVPANIENEFNHFNL
jgi:hypothetical protein